MAVKRFSMQWSSVSFDRYVDLKCCDFNGWPRVAHCVKCTICIMFNMSCVLRKLDFCLCGNNGADQKISSF